MQFSNRTQAQYHIARTTQITKENMKALNAEQVKDLANEGMVLLTLDQIEAIFVERNEIAKNNTRLGGQVSRLKQELAERQKGQDLYSILKKSLTEMSDEELSNLGLVTKERANAALKIAYDEVEEMRANSERAIKEVVKTYSK